AMIEAAQGAKRVLIVDETRRTGGVSEALMAGFAEATDLPVTRLAAEDSFIATGPAYGATLPSVESICATARQILSEGGS
ncbi:MAG: MFS transporter, partial [Pseudomonadota bacterium]